MQNISDLIKEAKPLYQARKKRNQRIKFSLMTLTCVVFVLFGMPSKRDIDDFSWWNLGECETSLTYVESLGLPVDDYGLLLVG